jgi:CHASE2 domain-containing sensor protein
MALRKRQRKAGPVVATSVNQTDWFWTVEGVEFHWHSIVELLSVVRDGQPVQVLAGAICFRLAVGYTLGGMAVVRHGEKAVMGE